MCHAWPGSRKGDGNVHAKAPFRKSQHVLSYLGRYTHRVGIANSRLIDVGVDHVSFRTRGAAVTTITPVVVPSAPRSTRPARGLPQDPPLRALRGCGARETARRPQPPAALSLARPLETSNLGRGASRPQRPFRHRALSPLRSSSSRSGPCRLLRPTRSPPREPFVKNIPTRRAALPTGRAPLPSGGPRFLLSPFEISLGPDAHRVPSDPAPPLAREHLRKRPLRPEPRGENHS